MGYSNGALSAATLMSLPEYADLATQVRGWLLASLHVAVPADKVFALSATRYVSMLLPKRKVYNSFDLANVTSDPEVIQRMEADPLFNRVGTMEFFAGIEARARALRTGRVRLNRDIRSVWVGHGTADKVHPYTDTKAWYDKQTHLEDGTFQTYDGWDHQLHASAPGTSEIFYKDIGDWILARAK
ncbi:hypothetical protein VTK73DRAFT_2127 [Phialemonium thermophilum]|uniref:Serine aminopeptidase S33 domain-containing protein n=1 Tax=Phialemonium thermophilum TaxID=223376 RepID=A0ABR3VSK2_9PEZI